MDSISTHHCHFTLQLNSSYSLFQYSVARSLTPATCSAVVGFVRSYGKILQEEDVLLNAVCPNKIRTNIGTAASYEKAEKAGCLVPMEKLLEAYEMLIAKDGKYSKISGECLEVAPKIGVRLAPKVEFVNEESRMSSEITLVFITSTRCLLTLRVVLDTKGLIICTKWWSRYGSQA